MTVTLRPATHDDYDAVAAFTRSTWEDGDYIPDVYHEWIEGSRKRTLVAVPDDTAGAETLAGIVQLVLLSEHEAWAQGLRVNPAYRGDGVATALTRALFDWGRDQGAVVARNMVFSWNQAGLGLSRAVGFEPATEFRWLHPTPDPDPDLASELDRPDGDAAATATAVSSAPSVSPAAVWSYWRQSEARERLAGLALAPEESWALRALTPAMLADAAAETALLAVTDDHGIRGFSYRTRTYERDGEIVAEYGVGAWDDPAAAARLLAAVAADAAAIGADRTRLLIPETGRYVSDGALLRVGLADEPDFVLAADLPRPD